MAEIKLNKTELKVQKTLLSQLSKYLPTLQLKKQQLQGEVENANVKLQEIETKMKIKEKEIAEWAILLSQKLTINILQFVRAKEVVKRRENIAGVEVPVYENVIFEDTEYSYFATPVWIDNAIAVIKEIVYLREEIKILRERYELLREELRQTSIKVNLFEKRMIPQCKENIKKIKIFLGDQEIAAICNAKIAKDKLKRKVLLQKLKAEAI